MADRGHAHPHLASAIDRASCQPGPRCFRHGPRLACEHRFIDLGLALKQLSIQRKAFARTHHDQVANEDFADRSIDFAVFTQDMGGVRPQRVQGPNGLRGLALGAGLKPFAHQHQGDDDR